MMRVDKPVARHFNAANHSISDINVCAFSHISGGIDNRKDTKSVSFLKMEQFSQNWNPFGNTTPQGINVMIISFFVNN